jgi:hypothetical protein
VQYVVAILWFAYIFHAIRLAERLHIVMAAAQAAAAAQQAQGQIGASNRRVPARPSWGPLRHVGPWVAQWIRQGEGHLGAASFAGPHSNSGVSTAA